MNRENVGETPKWRQEIRTPGPGTTLPDSVHDRIPSGDDPSDLDAADHCGVCGAELDENLHPVAERQVRELKAALRLISHMNDLGNIHTTASGALGET